MNVGAKTLSDLYLILEQKSDVRPVDFRIEPSVFVSEEQLCVRVEVLLWWDLNKVLDWPVISENLEQCKAYLLHRLSETSNPVLLYRYNLFLYALTKDNRYAGRSIDALVECLPSLLSDDEYLFHADAYKAIEDFAKLFKAKKDKQDTIVSTFSTILKSDWSGNETKLEILKAATDYSIFGVVDAPWIVTLCQGVFPQTCGKWRELCCELGLHYAAKMQKEGIPYAAWFNESLGDLEMSQLEDIDKEPNNIILPHINHRRLKKAIGYYKKAGVEIKMLEAQKQYRELGSRLRYLHLHCSRPANRKVDAYFQNLKQVLLEADSSVLVFALITLERFMLPPVDLLEKSAIKHINNGDAPRFTSVTVDINSNTHHIDPSEQAILELYGVWITNVMRQSILDVILSAIASGRLAYGKLRIYLKQKSTYGLPVNYTRGDESFSCSWLDQVDFAIKDLFRQYKRVIDGKPADWRIPIDTLPAKFEGMLRDIVGTEGGQATKVGKNQEMTAALLDDLLRDPVLKRSFSDEDILFFEYVFTPKGENIRNNVAHGFYKPCDYNIYRATLVFLAILRLAKYARTEG